MCCQSKLSNSRPEVWDAWASNWAEEWLSLPPPHSLGRVPEGVYKHPSTMAHLMLWPPGMRINYVCVWGADCFATRKKRGSTWSCGQCGRANIPVVMTEDLCAACFWEDSVCAIYC